MNINRRDFIKSAGGLAVAGVAGSIPVFAALQENASQSANKPRVAILFDETFPEGDIALHSKEVFLKALAQYEVSFLGAEDLKTKLVASTYDLFLNPYGSAFPVSAWETIELFLRNGGAWVNLGGIPLSIPVVRDGTAWRKEVRQTEYHKILGITQAFPVSSSLINSYRPGEAGSDALRDHFHASEMYELYVRFTVTKDYQEEDGSAGARDATIRPMVVGYGGDGTPLAAPIVAIDRQLGPYAGGRWALANFKGSIEPEGVAALVAKALEGSNTFSVRPSFACYHDGEVPSFTARLARPGGGLGRILRSDCRLEIFDERRRSVARLTLPLRGSDTLRSGMGSPGSRLELSPGLYHIDATARLVFASTGSVTLQAANGFWVFDRKLMDGGTPFTTDEYYLCRNGKPFPISGTTYMTSDVHRKFLFEPNPHLWDSDFGEMKKRGINLVRTGIWTGWKNYMLDVGAPNEPALRAMEAFVLTARRHGLPAIFTFFAFLPEAWGGLNPYLDPRSVAAQKEFVMSIVQRFSSAKEILWDFINEPSFCSPEHLWKCRPNYDEYEIAAWKDWLMKRYPAPTEDDRRMRLAELYRATPGEAMALPKDEEFDNVNIFNDRRPVRVIDYRLFAQEMFRRWVKEMGGAVRAAARVPQLMTVGQDEGGAFDRPNPQLFGDAVDFTCNHNWWLNDNLVWDNVVTKRPDKPNLIEETGVMFYEKMDGTAWRSEEDARNLLERKLAISVGCGGAGFVEWLWNTNPYMPSDNEAAIGLFRPDGTAKPELRPLEALARFLGANRERMIGRVGEPVVMVIPHSQVFSTRDYGTEATQRCVRVMHYLCCQPMDAVSEYGLSAMTDLPRLIVLPSPRTLASEAWSALMALVDKGTTLLLSGTIDADDHWMPAERLKQLGISAATRPVTEEEFLSIDGTEVRLSYRGDKIQRVEKAVVESEGVVSISTISRGPGRIIWSPLPVELSDSVEPIASLYRYALKSAGIKPAFIVEQPDPSILVRPLVFKDAILCAFVSESDRDSTLALTHIESNSKVTVRVPAQRVAMMFVDRKNGRVLSQYG